MPEDNGTFGKWELFFINQIRIASKLPLDLPPTSSKFECSHPCWTLSFMGLYLLIFLCEKKNKIKCKANSHTMQTIPWKMNGCEASQVNENKKTEILNIRRWTLFCKLLPTTLLFFAVLFLRCPCLLLLLLLFFSVRRSIVCVCSVFFFCFSFIFRISNVYLIIKSRVRNSELPRKKDRIGKKGTWKNERLSERVNWAKWKMGEESVLLKWCNARSYFEWDESHNNSNRGMAVKAVFYVLLFALQSATAPNILRKTSEVDARFHSA